MTQPQGYQPPPPGYQPGPPVPPKKTSPVVWILSGCAIIVVLGAIVVGAVAWFGYRAAKNALDTSAGQMNSVTQLWSDVPPLEGMTPSQQAEMPLAIRLLARPFLDALMRGLNNGKEAGHWDVAFYVVTGKTIRDVEAFYVPARMGKFGWQPQGGCANMSQAVFCSFQKKAGDKGTGLLIVAADDEQTKSTALYFIRGEGQETGNETGK
jgi:hypothetical protein